MLRSPRGASRGSFPRTSSLGSSAIRFAKESPSSKRRGKDRGIHRVTVHVLEVRQSTLMTPVSKKVTRSVRLLSLLVLLGAAVSSTSASAACSSVADLSNLRLVGALPVEIESVLVMRIHELGSDESLLAQWVEYMENPDEGSDLGFDGAPDLSLLIENGAARAGLHTLVWGGSRFVAPEGIGASRANFRKILITSRSLRHLHDSLHSASQRDPDLEHVRSGSVEHFRTRISTRSGHDGIEMKTDYLVSFFDMCTVLTAQSRADIESMTAALKSGRSHTRFERVAQGVGTLSPVFLVRDLLPPLLDGQEDRIAEPEPLAMALALPDPTKPRFEIALLTDAPETEAMRYFRKVAVAYLMSGRDYDLQVAPGPDGFRGELVIKPDPHEPYNLALIAFWLFGMWMTI